MTDDDDLSRMRMRIGEGAQNAMDVMDSEVLALMNEISEPVRRLQRLLLDRGVPQQNRLNLFIAFGVAAALDENP